MRIAAFGVVGSWLVLGAMVTVAGKPGLSAAQVTLLAGGIALAMVNVLILFLCDDAWHAMCEYYEEHELHNT